MACKWGLLTTYQSWDDPPSGGGLKILPKTPGIERMFNVRIIKLGLAEYDETNPLDLSPRLMAKQPRTSITWDDLHC